VDTLAGGSFCGLIEETAKDGIAWYHVFYLDSARKGATGYIKAEDAELLSDDDLRALMTDMEKANEIMDLFDALDAYLNDGETKLTEATNAIPSAIGKPTVRKTLGKIYDYGMALLDRILNSDIPAKVGQALENGIEKAGEVLEAGKTTAGKLLEAGKAASETVTEGAKKLVEDGKKAAGELLEAGKKTAETVTEGAKKLLEDAGDKLNELLPKAEEKLSQLADKASETYEYLTNGEGKEKIDNLKDQVKNTVDSLTEEAGEKFKSLQDNVQKALDTLDGFAGEQMGKALNKLADQTRNMLDDTFVQNSPYILQGLAGVFKSDKFSGGIQAIYNIIELYKTMNSGGN
jgi:ElaB/YqjD/DUF883 family membrane-anchored ribosome-binding protein